MFKYIFTATLAIILFFVFFFDAELSNESVGTLLSRVYWLACLYS